MYRDADFLAGDILIRTQDGGNLKYEVVETPYADRQMLVLLLNYDAHSENKIKGND